MVLDVVLLMFSGALLGLGINFGTIYLLTRLFDWVDDDLATVVGVIILCILSFLVVRHGFNLITDGEAVRNIGFFETLGLMIKQFGFVVMLWMGYWGTHKLTRW